jgi:hypothetical protein
MDSRRAWPSDFVRIDAAAFDCEFELLAAGFPSFSETRFADASADGLSCTAFDVSDPEVGGGSLVILFADPGMRRR